MLGVLEKLNLVLTALALVAVGGGVTALSLMPGGLRSGFPEAMEGSIVATDAWLEGQRSRAGGSGLQLDRDYVGRARPTGPQAAPTPGRPGRPRPQAPAETAQIVPETRTDYYAGNAPIPLEEQVPGIPWLRQMPGVRYKQPKRVPEVLYQKYQSFEDAWDLVQEGGGEFVETDLGTAYQVNWVQQSSLLYTKIGLRPGDKVISVNGQPVGQSMAAGRAMYDQMRGESRFAVLVERQGQKVVLSYQVQAGR